MFKLLMLSLFEFRWDFGYLFHLALAYSFGIDAAVWKPKTLHSYNNRLKVFNKSLFFIIYIRFFPWLQDRI